MIAARVTVTGRVQGVGFRWFARAEARRLGVAGWVRNLPDGSVEVWVEGHERAVDELIAWLAHGPPAALVADVVVEQSDPASHQDFEIRH